MRYTELTNELRTQVLRAKTYTWYETKIAYPYQEGKKPLPKGTPIPYASKR